MPVPERLFMQIPLQISFENAEPSETVRTAIGHEVERLEKYQHRITGCRVAVVAPSTKHRHGAVYRINIWVTIPPHENIVVSHQPSDDRGHVHVEVAIKDAFCGRPTPNRGSGTTRERQGQAPFSKTAKRLTNLRRSDGHCALLLRTWQAF